MEAPLTMSHKAWMVLHDSAEVLGDIQRSNGCKRCHQGQHDTWPSFCSVWLATRPSCKKELSVC